MCCMIQSNGEPDQQAAAGELLCMNPHVPQPSVRFPSSAGAWQIPRTIAVFHPPRSPLDRSAGSLLGFHRYRISSVGICSSDSKPEFVGRIREGDEGRLTPWARRQFLSSGWLQYPSEWRQVWNLTPVGSSLGMILYRACGPETESSPSPRASMRERGRSGIERAGH